MTLLLQKNSTLYALQCCFGLFCFNFVLLNIFASKIFAFSEKTRTESSMFRECFENFTMYERRRHVLLCLGVSGLTTSFPVALSVRQYERLACGVHNGTSSGCLVIRLLPATLLSVAKHRLCLFHLSMGCVP